MPALDFRSRMPVSAEELFAWHARPGAIDRLLPPWELIEVLERNGGIQDGARLVFQMQKGPIKLPWVAVHQDYREGRSFTDVQKIGPFARWEHTHHCLPEGDESLLHDHLDYALPMGFLGELLGGRMARASLQRMFRFRHQRTFQDLLRHREFAGRGPQRIAITGAAGFVGEALTAFFTTGGHQVLRISRRGGPPNTVRWDPARGELDTTELEGVDAVIHLAAAPLVGGRWTPAQKEEIQRSRVEGTRFLVESLARLRQPPRVLLSASAVGCYGERGEELLTETSPPGEGFLPQVCTTWEAAADAAADAGIRVVHLRTGPVLSARGGMLGRLLPSFRWGLGGVAGSGRQWVSWIALDDVLGAIQHLIFADTVFGPVNLTAPQPARNAEFAHTLGRVLRRPSFLTVPASVVRAFLGELGEALLLESTRALPEMLEQSGFRFLFPDLESALRFELGAGEGWPRMNANDEK